MIIVSFAVLDSVPHCQERPRRVHWYQVQRRGNWPVSSHQRLRGPGIHCFWPLCMERVTKVFSYMISSFVWYICVAYYYLFLVDLSLFITISGWPTWEPTGTRWRRRPWWRPSQRCADTSFLWISTRWVTCLTHQKQSNYHWCEVLLSFISSYIRLDVGGAGEEPYQLAIHHSYSSDARWWNDLAGTWGAVFRASPRCGCIQKLWCAHSSVIELGKSS